MNLVGLEENLGNDLDGKIIFPKLFPFLSNLFTFLSSKKKNLGSQKKLLKSYLENQQLKLVNQNNNHNNNYSNNNPNLHPKYTTEPLQLVVLI